MCLNLKENSGAKGLKEKLLTQHHIICNRLFSETERDSEAEKRDRRVPVRGSIFIIIIGGDSHYATNRQIADSIPDGVIRIFR